MDPSYPDFYINLGDSSGYPNTQYYENHPIFSNPSQTIITQNPQTSQNTEKQSRTSKWEAAEDVALMSAWCMVSGDSIHGKNQKITGLWTRIKELYDAAQQENPEKLGKRNLEQMKGRFKRLNENAQKWVGACREAYRNGRSGMNQRDIESAAHKIYEQGGSKYNDIIVYNEVMCKHPKWDLQLQRDASRTRPEIEVDNEESGSSTKRTRTTEEGDYSNPTTPTSDASTMQRPIGRDAAKKKAKGKISNEFVEEIRALRLTRVGEIEIMKKKLDFEKEKENKKEERERKKEEREQKKMELLHLNTLLQKEHLSSEDENMKRFLMSKYYGN